MKVVGTQPANTNIQFQRLLSEDIVRLPSKKTNIADFYAPKNEQISAYKKKQARWRNVFTALTFGITGLFIAHRNNLFNPPKREMKKIINNEVFVQKVKDRVYSLIGDDTFIRVTIKLLSKFSKSEPTKSKAFADEANKILSSTQGFSDIYRKVQQRLLDDPNTESWKKGFVVDVLDKLAVSVENDLKKAREEGRDFKELGKQFINTYFEPTKNKHSHVDETLFEVIKNRITSTVENYVADSAINAKFAKK